MLLNCSAPERRCGLTSRVVDLLLPSGLPCSPPVDVELTACSGVCGTSFVEGSIVFSGDVAFPHLRSLSLLKRE